MNWALVTVLDVATVALLAAGCFFGLTGAVGLLRFPDFYTRLHASGKNDSFAQALILGGLVCHAMTGRYDGSALIATKLTMVSVAILVTAPTATHAIAKAAHLSGLVPWGTEERRDG